MAVTTYKVFLLEDNLLVRRMLKDFLENEDDLAVVGEASSAEEALEQLPETDLVLVDLSLPGMTGIEFVRAYQERNGVGRCLVVTAHAEPFYKKAAFKAGAAGFVTKDSPEELLGAVRAALQGVA